MSHEHVLHAADRPMFDFLVTEVIVQLDRPDDWRARGAFGCELPALVRLAAARVI